MNKIKYIIKYSPLIYNLYFYVFSGLIRLLGVFVKTDNNLILFNSFGGRKYDDSPRAIFESMLADERFNNYTLVWALNEPEKFTLPERAVVVKDYTLQFFINALKAKVWITNSSMEHGLCFKKKSTIYINTWHGSAIKYLGKDVKEEGKSFKGKSTSKEDAFYTQSEFDEYVAKRAFGKTESELKRFGLPRNDELACFKSDKANSIREELKIDPSKRVILYAPTFREYSRSSTNEITQEMHIDLTRWDREMGDKYILLVRVHYEVAKLLDFTAHRSVINVSDYPHLNDLLIISDAMVSDYSSIFIDYSILHRPMLCFAYDIDEYTRKRGMYLDIKKELPCNLVFSEDDLYGEIGRVFQQYNCYCNKTAQFQKKYVTACGNASKTTCDYLADKLQR